MATLWQDIKYGLRMVARNPGFTLLVVGILTIGISANTAVFSVVNTVLLQALPYDDPGKVVEIRELDKDRRLRPRPVSPRTLAYWREHNRVFDHVAGWTSRGIDLTGLGEPFRVSARAVSSCFFSVVGVPPEFGRAFLPQEEQRGHDHVVLVSHAFWRDHLSGDPQAVGKSITVNGENCTVIGVMPDGYRDTPWANDTALWMPLVLDSVGADERINVWARLKRGVGMDQARVDMTVLEQQLSQADPPSYRQLTVSVERLADRWLGSERRLLYPLWGAVVLVLLIACMNAGGLFLVHGNARRQEMALRVTLGASRGRILCQLLTESLLLSLTAGLFGVLAASWMIKGIVALCPADVYQIGQTRIDGTVLFFTLGLSLLAALASGLLPAWKAAATCRVQTLRQESSGSVLDRDWRRLSSGLVVAQITVALTLLMGVGMLIQSLVRLQREDLGFQPEKVAVMRITFPAPKYPEGRRAAALLNQILQRVQTLPSVRSAAVISDGLHLGVGAGHMVLTIDGRPPDAERMTWADLQIVTADFFTTLGMRVLAGRGFRPEDLQGGGKGVLIDENLARRYFPGQDPMGHQIAMSGRDGGPILGVVSRPKDYSTLDRDTVAVYWPLSEDACWSSRADVVVRVDEEPLRLAPTLRAQVADLDKDLEVSWIKTIEEILSPMLAPRRFATILLGAFAQIALIVAAIGLYGLLQYSVARRTHEIGIRMALGATQGLVVRTVICQGGLLILMGVGLGLAGGYVMSRVVASLLYKASPADPAMLALVLTTLLVTALAACWIPVRRAAKIDPMKALRCE